MTTNERAKCDLVMKGGITSGVVYPAAVKSLSEQYNFVSIGGASAGAVAAAVTAAAQFARAGGGLERFDAVRAELQQEGLFLRLFQPTKETRPLLDVALGLQAAQTSWQRTRWFFGRVLRRLLLPMAVWTAAGFAALAILLGHAGATLREEFNWDDHQLRRYQIFMGMLQDGLSPRPEGSSAALRPPTVSDAWQSGLRDRISGYGSAPPSDPERDAAWYAAAAKATDRLLADADEWLATHPVPPRQWFRPTQPLIPPASMRITPDV